MERDKLIEKLHPLERKVFPLLDKHRELSSIQKASGLKEVEVMRALQWLANKSLLKIDVNLKDIVELDINGKKYLDRGLPEIRFLSAVEKGASTLEEIRKKAELDKSEINVCIGMLKRKLAIEIGKGMKFKITEQGKKMLEKETLEEVFLKKLKSGPKEIKDLEAEEKFALEGFKKRKNIIKTNLLKIREIELTDKGKRLLKKGIGTEDVVDVLTPQMIKTGSWKNKNFRSYDVEINVPQISGGKRHFLKSAIENARQIWLEMGFREIKGPLIQTSFWNFDALFTAQDHPVREMQDTFYIKNPKDGKLPDVKIVNKVKKAHEKGVSGSTGWQYRWDEKEAKKNVLRTHTTVLTARALAELKKSDMPAKFFSVARCFRNETLDWSHLFEFNQTDGIVVDENANFRHLLGYLKEFFAKMGFPKARFRPAYFPYTEPSVEIDVFHPVHKQWFELGGAGMFRPEVVVPLLGEDIPVLAWGPGFDRIIMDYYKITDIRDLYKNDIKQLREMKAWMR